ncbi:MAG: sulfatase-like hydrolase/transferase [Planctomycetaceae bacterium]
MAIHAAMVDRMDQEIGRILDQLRVMGVFDNTLILFLSDNGASAEIMVRGDGHDPQAPPGSAATHLCLGPGWSSVSNTPFRRHKTWVHEGGICTPLIVHWPTDIAARGELRHAPGHVIDFVPTVLDLVGADEATTTAAHDGPPRPGSASPGHSHAAAQPTASSAVHEGNNAFRMGDWKLVRAKDQPWSCNDLGHDRTETHDRASRQSERACDMSTRWQEIADSFVDLKLLLPTATQRERRMNANRGMFLALTRVQSWFPS